MHDPEAWYRAIYKKTGDRFWGDLIATYGISNSMFFYQNLIVVSAMAKHIICLALFVALTGCAPAKNTGTSDKAAVEASESTGVTISSVAPAAKTLDADLTKFFGNDKAFCDYANNLDIITPKGAVKGPLKTGKSFWDSSLAKFDGTLHGLKVVGVANFRMEGIGANAILFDEPGERVLEVLGKIYGGTAGYFPTSTAPDKSVACPDCEITGDHPEFTAIRNAAHTRDFYGLGQSALECGFFD